MFRIGANHTVAAAAHPLNPPGRPGGGAGNVVRPVGDRIGAPAVARDGLATAAETFSNARRGVNDHEDAAGHTLDRHVGQTVHDLRNRIDAEGIDAASTFPDRRTADRTIGHAISQHRGTINTWLTNPANGNRLTLPVQMRAPIGSVLQNGDYRPNPSPNANVVLLRDGSEHGYHVLTAYPVR